MLGTEGLSRVLMLGWGADEVLGDVWVVRKTDGAREGYPRVKQRRKRYTGKDWVGREEKRHWKGCLGVRRNTDGAVRDKGGMGSLVTHARRRECEGCWGRSLQRPPQRWVAGPGSLLQLVFSMRNANGEWSWYLILLNED